MKFTRILSLCLALLMVASLLAACKPAEEPEPEPEGPNTWNIITEGITEYVIVRDYKASNEIIDAVNSMVTSIKLNIGADVTIKECFNDLEDEPLDVETEKEILVGMTNREESAQALNGMRSRDYTISMHGEKLIIGGGGDSGTVTAITKFLNDYVAEQGNRFAVKQGEMQNLVITTKNSITETGKYSYSSTQMAGVRVDSFSLIYPKNTSNSNDCKIFAETLSDHISKECGFELKVYKDTRYWCDYEILIGDTIRTDDDLVKSLGPDEYYIKLVKTEVTYEDGSTHPGAQLFICFGKNAMDAALKAFTKTVMPVTSEVTTFSLPENFELTNRAAS